MLKIQIFQDIPIRHRSTKRHKYFHKALYKKREIVLLILPCSVFRGPFISCYFPFSSLFFSQSKLLNLNKDFFPFSSQLISLLNYYLDHVFFPETFINLCHMLELSIQIPNLCKKKKTITTGLTGELFHLSPCDVVSFSCESSIAHIPSNCIEFLTQ